MSIRWCMARICREEAGPYSCGCDMGMDNEIYCGCRAENRVAGFPSGDIWLCERHLLMLKGSGVRLLGYGLVKKEDEE